MSEKSNFHVELPDNLKGKFRSLERKLWLADTAIALSGLAAGLVCFYLLLFVSDRFWDTPAGVRLLFTSRGVGKRVDLYACVLQLFVAPSGGHSATIRAQATALPPS